VLHPLFSRAELFQGDVQFASARGARRVDYRSRFNERRGIVDLVESSASNVYRFLAMPLLKPVQDLRSRSTVFDIDVDPLPQKPDQLGAQAQCRDDNGMLLCAARVFDRLAQFVEQRLDGTCVRFTAGAPNCSILRLMLSFFSSRLALACAAISPAEYPACV
jgi:hypothetical protein